MADVALGSSQNHPQSQNDAPGDPAEGAYDMNLGTRESLIECGDEISTTIGAVRSTSPSSSVLSTSHPISRGISPAGVPPSHGGPTGPTTSVPRDTGATTPNVKERQRAIRLIPIPDHNHPNSTIDITERRLSGGAGVIRVGRSESSSDAAAIRNGAEPIVYKSKVVSRNHAEILLENSTWYVRDVASSSGTFLNGVRLSEPGKQSDKRPLKHGDVLQFGVHFRGGVQQLFRAVKLLVSIDGGSSRTLSNYNTESFKDLRNSFQKVVDAVAVQDEVKREEPEVALQECCICLQALKPGEPMFISPCMHGWHYQCIRPVLIQSYPLFDCPNCRRMFDVEEASDSDREAPC